MTDFSEFNSRLSNLSGKGEIRFTTDEPMSKHTSFKVGGKADFFILPQSERALKDVIVCAHECGVHTYVMGKGTNILFDDAGFRGAVVSTCEIDYINVEGTLLYCGAGTLLSSVSRFALDFSLEGMSFAYGIPGSVGGAVYMNAGAYNGSVDCVLRSSTYYDLSDGEFHTISNAEHSFAYRYSSYMNRPERIIVSASFYLKEGSKTAIKAEMDDFMSRRKDKQPLEYPSAGSTFKRYPGKYTAQMIDEVGLKGVSVGGAAVSEKHAGFVINKGGATSADIKKLISLIQHKIKDAYGIDIEREVIYVPFEGEFLSKNES